MLQRGVRSIGEAIRRHDREDGELRVSPRQAEILQLLAGGYSDKEIGNHLGISSRTVGAHLEQLYDRSGVHRRAGLIALWIRQDTP